MKLSQAILTISMVRQRKRQGFVGGEWGLYREPEGRGKEERRGKKVIKPEIR